MTKAELIEKLYLESKYFSQKDIDKMVNELFSYLSQSLAKGHRIEIRGFGSFSLRFYQPRMGRNPSTGESIQLPAKAIPHFKAGKRLKERINRNL